MASRSQNQQFTNEMIEDTSFLDNAISWISLNMGMDDVFDIGDIKEKAREKITNEELVEWFRDDANASPEEVFDFDELETWALENGFKKEE